MKNKIQIFIKTFSIQDLFKYINKIPLSRIIGLIILYPIIRVSLFLFLSQYFDYKDPNGIKTIDNIINMDNGSMFFGLTFLAGAYLFKKK